MEKGVFVTRDVTSASASASAPDTGNAPKTGTMLMVGGPGEKKLKNNSIFLLRKWYMYFQHQWQLNAHWCGGFDFKFLV